MRLSSAGVDTIENTSTNNAFDDLQITVKTKQYVPDPESPTTKNTIARAVEIIKNEDLSKTPQVKNIIKDFFL